MEEALINLSEFFYVNVYLPFFNFLQATKWLTEVRYVINRIFNNFFGLFNEREIANNQYINNQILAEIITLIIFIVTIMIVVKLFLAIGKALKEAFQETKDTFIIKLDKKGGHKVVKKFKK